MIEIIFEISFQLGELLYSRILKKIKGAEKMGSMQDPRSKAGERENAFC